MFFSKYYRTEAADVNTHTKTRPLIPGDITPRVKVLAMLDAADRRSSHRRSCPVLADLLEQRKRYQQVSAVWTHITAKYSQEHNSLI